MLRDIAGVDLDFDGAHLLDDPRRFCRAFGAAFLRLDEAEQASLREAWDYQLLSAVTISADDPAHVDGDLRIFEVRGAGAFLHFPAPVINSMADDELETLIASTLCAAVQRIVCLTFPTSADRQEHGDRRLRILGYDPAALDDFVEVFLRDDGPNKSA